MFFRRFLPPLFTADPDTFLDLFIPKAFNRALFPYWNSYWVLFRIFAVPCWFGSGWKVSYDFH